MRLSPNWAELIATAPQTREPQAVYGLGLWGKRHYFNAYVCIFEAMQLVTRLGQTRWRERLEAKVH
jgi:hypothetical protein